MRSHRLTPRRLRLLPRATFLIAAALAALTLFLHSVQGQNAPTITGDSAASVAEGTATTTVIKTYMASDMDDDPLTWSLEGVDSGDFTLTENSGMTGYELKFSAVPDYEDPADDGEDNVYNVTIKVVDDESPPMEATKAVTITVTDVNEAPVIDTTDDAYDFAENTDITTAVATFEATDPDDGAMLTWSAWTETTPGTSP